MNGESLWEATPAVDYMREAGRDGHPSHDWVTERLAALYPESPFDLLDCGVMSGVTYERLRRAGMPVNYVGIDIAERIVEDCRSRFPEASWRRMSITDLAFEDLAFDVVNCRHILGHLPYYETALREAFRVSRRHVFVCLFQVPREPERLLRRETKDGYIWLNRYAPGPLEELLGRLSSNVECSDVAYERRMNRIYHCIK
jgi:ubiquinone/menaquinone biosynthesis C-methylase UbiE